jgi:cytochrome o ubiquinol oxidase subunit 1
MKENGIAYKRPKEYHDIHMPKNTPAGLFMGVFTLGFGFAMVWHVWWLAIVSIVALVATVINVASNDDVEYVIPAAEVKKIEDERFRLLSENLEANNDVMEGGSK